MINKPDPSLSKMTPLKSNLLTPNLCPETTPKKQSSLIEINPEESSILNLPQENK